jgi:hypothetical protein
MSGIQEKAFRILADLWAHQNGREIISVTFSEVGQDDAWPYDKLHEYFPKDGGVAARR